MYRAKYSRWVMQLCSTSEGGEEALKVYRIYQNAFKVEVDSFHILEQQIPMLDPYVEELFYCFAVISLPDLKVLRP